jgi:hypothetical protein
MRSFIRPVSVLLLGAIFSFSLSAAPRSVQQAGMSYDNIARIGDLINRSTLVIDATVESIIDPAAATYGNPPRVRLRILETYKGDPAATLIEARWTPPPNGIDTNNYEAELAAWNAIPFPPPPTGSRWILAGSIREGVFTPHRRCQIPYTRDERNRILTEVHTGGLDRLIIKNQENADRAMQDKADLKQLFDASETVLIIEDDRMFSHGNPNGLPAIVRSTLKSPDAMASEPNSRVFLEARPDSRTLFVRRLLDTDRGADGTPVTFAVFGAALPDLVDSHPDFPSAQGKRRVIRILDPLAGVLTLTPKQREQLEAMRVPSVPDPR